MPKSTRSKSKRGGPRPGAGHPTNSERGLPPALVPLPVKVPPSVKRWYVAEAKRRKMAVNSLANKALTDFIATEIADLIAD